MVKDGEVFFDRVASQRVRWQERGGALVTWSRNYGNGHEFGPHEAILLQECPSRMTLLRKAVKDTTVIGVIYNRPHWYRLEEALRTRRQWPEFGEKMQHRIRQLHEIQAFVAGLPPISPHAIAQTRRALLASLPPWSFPVSPADVGLWLGTDY